MIYPTTKLQPNHIQITITTLVEQLTETQQRACEQSKSVLELVLSTEQYGGRYTWVESTAFTA